MAKEISIISLTAINNGAHYNFMQSAAEKAKDDAKVYAKLKDQVDALIAAVANENANLVKSRKNTQSDVIRKADKERDVYYRGYRAGVKNFRNFPEGAQKNAADTLWQHIIDYGKIERMQLDRKTGILSNFLEDLEFKYMGEINFLQLNLFVNNLKTANEKVRKTVNIRDHEKSSGTKNALKLSRKVTDNAYLAIVRKINAFVEVDGTSDYDGFILFMNELIYRFKHEVLPQKTAEERKLKKLIPAFEVAKKLALGTLTYTGRKGKNEEGKYVYQLMARKDKSKINWVVVDKDRLLEAPEPPKHSKGGKHENENKPDIPREDE